METQTAPEIATPPPVLVTPAGAAIQVTERAIAKAKDFAAATPEGAGKGLRVYVQGGGCSGFSYGFTLDEKRDGDEVIVAGTMEVLVDPMSLNYIKGATLDYVEDFRGSGFVVQNPNATGNCGCGQSFTV